MELDKRVCFTFKVIRTHVWSVETSDESDKNKCSDINVLKRQTNIVDYQQSSLHTERNQSIDVALFRICCVLLRKPFCDCYNFYFYYCLAKVMHSV